MLVSFLYNIRAVFLSFSFSFAVSETYCVLLCGVKVGMSMRVAFVFVYIMNLFFLCMLCKGGATLFQASPFLLHLLHLLYILLFVCLFVFFLNCCF